MASSPNWDERAPGVPLRFIVLHYTGMVSTDAAMARLCSPESRVSAHYLIDEGGALIPLVDTDKRAWHAGVSFWKGLTDLNSASFGIELANPGHEFGYRPFPEAQLATLLPLLHSLIARHGLDRTEALVGHSDIAPERKSDPGELFPWQRLAEEEGLGLWPSPTPDDEQASPEADEPAHLLRALGYAVDGAETPTRTTSEGLVAALTAFQRRYRPEKVTGKADKETLARLRALTRAYAQRPVFCANDEARGAKAAATRA